MEEKQMGKGILICSIFFIVLFGTLAIAQTATQQVTVTVILGIINIKSPVDKIYQENTLPVSIDVTTPLDVDSIQMFDNGLMSYLCTKCKKVEKKVYFSEGEHNLIIRVKFKSGETIEESVKFEIDSGSEIYVQTNAGLKKASTKEILDYLFHYNFTLTHKDELTPEDACSVRAKDGTAVFNGINSTRNKLNFYSVRSLEQGQGELSGQDKGKRFSMSFKVNRTIENSDSLLKLEIVNKKDKKGAILEFYKKDNTISVSGEGFLFEGMGAYYVKGCSSRKESFYLLAKDGRVSRSIEEVRKILEENPIFTSSFENLKFLFSPYWRIQRFFI